jgi:7-cyano-7-deazaguanine reductase
LQSRIAQDLSAGTGAKVQVRLHETDQDTAISNFDGSCIDGIDTHCNVYNIDATLLTTGDGDATEALHSHQLRSLCPVTNQPDLGSVMIHYSGPRIDAAGLLRYIVSYRLHNDFHEACVERMFLDISERCQPEKLTVYARYQRRGGIDINPFRSNFENAPLPARLPRQ